jgi:hypothetical protein
MEMPFDEWDSSMSNASRHLAWAGLWLCLAVGAVMLALILFGKRASAPTAATVPASPDTVPSTVPATTYPANFAIHTYGQLLHADLPGYPDTRPWGVPVDLADAAHVILREPVYVCSRRDLWITRKDADPLQTVLARAADESEHFVDCPVRYVVWAPNARGVWEPSIICPRGNGLALVSATKERKLPATRPYEWTSAMTWDDGGHTRLIVPAGTGVSIFTLGTTITESFMDLGLSAPATSPDRTQPPAAANPTSQATTIPLPVYAPPPTSSSLPADVPAPQIVFDLRGLLAWIPSDGAFRGPSRVARFVDGQWQTFDSAAWPSSIIHLVPMLDGSVLQIRRGADDPDVQLTVVPLDNPAINKEDIANLVTELGDDDADKRATALERLNQYGPGVFPILESMSPTASPEAQSRIAEILQGRLTTKLGGMQINANQLSVFRRLRDGGVILFAPQGVSIPRAGQDPEVISPDYVVIRPGQPVRELPSAISASLTKNLTAVDALSDEWIVNSSDAGVERYLPPDQFVPLIRPSETAYTRVAAIDGRGRWLLRKSDAAGANSTSSDDESTLILDPTIPDPTPRLAIWMIDVASKTGWDKADWPALQKGTACWTIGDRDWQPLDGSGEAIATVFTAPAFIPPARSAPATSTAITLPTTTSPATTSPANLLANTATATAPTDIVDTPKGPVLLVDADGNQYFDGKDALIRISRDGSKISWPLPTDCAGKDDERPWLVRDRDGHLFLFNQAGRIIRLRATPDPSAPFAVEAIFTGGDVQPFHDIARIWLDPAGRIDVSYASSHLALIFPTGQVPPEILDRILPQDLRRPDAK